MNPARSPYFPQLCLDYLERSARQGCEVEWPNQVRVTIGEVIQTGKADLYGSECYVLPDETLRAIGKTDFKVTPVFATISSRADADQCTLLSLRIGT